MPTDVFIESVLADRNDHVRQPRRGSFRGSQQFAIQAPFLADAAIAKQSTARTHQIIIVQSMHQTHSPALNLLPSSHGKSTDVVGVYDIRHFGIQNFADPASRHRVPHFPNMPGEATENTGLLTSAKGPVEIIQRKTVEADPAPILDNFTRPWVHPDNHP